MQKLWKVKLEMTRIHVYNQNFKGKAEVLTTTLLHFTTTSP